MSLQQLEAFLGRAQTDPSLQAPLAAAPDAAAVAAIAHQAGFAVTAEDLLAAAGMNHDPKDFKRVASARSLYHWNADANQEY